MFFYKSIVCIHKKRGNIYIFLFELVYVNYILTKILVNQRKSLKRINVHFKKPGSNAFIHVLLTKDLVGQNDVH